LESVSDVSGLIGPEDYSKVFKPKFDNQYAQMKKCLIRVSNENKKPYPAGRDF
jgi:hypothetical protein